MRAKLIALLAMVATTAIPAPAAASSSDRPSLVVAIAVDQFSADLFAQYRAHYRGGLKRLSDGVVFPRGYQSHAATETCPGHATILTGNRPGHAGIIANNWIDQSVARADKRVYCAEDPSAPDSSSRNYAPSLMRLRVPTLGDRMKAADPGSRVIAVAGKDRAALMMGGHKADQIWWWGANGFTGLPGHTATPPVERANAAARTEIATGRAAMALPDHCVPLDQPVALPSGGTVGAGHFERAPGDAGAFRASPELDTATLALATALVEDQALGRRGHVDLLAISLSATDLIGHRYGTAGAEMCLQVTAIDAMLGRFFEQLDKTGVDYLVALTADHGGHDLPERSGQNAIDDARRIDKALTLAAVNSALADRTGIKGPLLLGDGLAGDLYLRRDLSSAEKRRALTEALALLRAHPQAAAVLTHDELAAAPEPSGPPEAWSLLDEAKASFDPERSGDLVLLLKPRVTPIADPAHGTVATHGSPWDYDRRVPILFWRKGIVPFEQPLGVETVDITPSIAAIIGLSLPKGEIDGRCLDLIAGPETSCRAQ